jgi:hypothetical protein
MPATERPAICKTIADSLIGSDGGNEMYVLDKRREKLQFGILPYVGGEDDFIPLGETFEEFVRHLYYNDFWQIKDSNKKSQREWNPTLHSMYIALERCKAQKTGAVPK